MLTGNDVFDVKRRQGRGFLRKPTILTPVSSVLTHKCSKSRVHHLSDEFKSSRN